jgi:putative SOS response-associated peptidase YedK
MCGRFHNHVEAMHQGVDALNKWPEGHAVGFNISPTQSVPIVLESATVSARWGLVPKWEKSFSTKYPTHNARLETVGDKPSFRSAWKHARTCLIPAAGFYEWKKEGSIKQPYYIHNPNGLLVFAGLWESWNHQISFTILTTDSRGAVANLHHRMPVMLDTADATEWLSVGLASHELLEKSEVVEALEYYPVSTQVNNSRSVGLMCSQRLTGSAGPNQTLDF